MVKQYQSSALAFKYDALFKYVAAQTTKTFHFNLEKCFSSF